MSENNSANGAIFRDADEVLASDILRRVRTYDGPPVRIDVLEASNEELARYGLPRRPDPQEEPELARLWARTFSRPFEYVPAELSIDTVMGLRDPLWRHPGHPRGLDSEGSFGPSGWGGAVAFPKKLIMSGVTADRRIKPYLAGPANVVYGQWTIPGVFPASNPAGDIIAGFWVGIDGWGNGQVLQAGVAVTVRPDATVRWWAWTEWWTQQFKDPPVAVDNFPVTVGDTVTVLVCALSPEWGFAAFHNLTTGQVTSVGIPGRPNIPLIGATAEWIVEGISADLPVFLPVTFSGCVAGTKRSAFDLLPSGVTTEIAGDDSGEQLTRSTIAGENAAIVEWEGWS